MRVGGFVEIWMKGGIWDLEGWKVGFGIIVWMESEGVFYLG